MPGGKTAEGALFCCGARRLGCWKWCWGSMAQADFRYYKKRLDTITLLLSVVEGIETNREVFGLIIKESPAINQ